MNELGYLWILDTDPVAVYDAEHGRVDVSRKEAEEHNRELSSLECKAFWPGERTRFVAYYKGGESVGTIGALTTWLGEIVAPATVTGRWRIRKGWVGSHMISVQAVINGRRYYGRGCGNGMSIIMRRKEK